MQIKELKMKIGVIFTRRDKYADPSQKDWEGRDTNDDAESVMTALKELGHDVTSYYVDLDIFEKLRKEKNNLDLVFNLCDDGFFSDPELEPHVPAMLDLLGIPYTGSSYLSLALCLNKARAKKLLAYHKIPTPEFNVFKKATDKSSLDFPLIVKPVHEDASIGIRDESVVNNADELSQRIRHIIDEYNQPALVESYIDGSEYNVGVIGDIVLPVSEIKFDLPSGKPRIVNYSAKWKEGSIDYNGTVRQCPANITSALKKRLVKLALRAANLMLCRDYFRVDFRVDKKGNPYILEVNPNPDISLDAGLAAMVKVQGYEYKKMISVIIESALSRGKHGGSI